MPIESSNKSIQTSLYLMDKQLYYKRVYPNKSKECETYGSKSALTKKDDSIPFHLERGVV